jgi:pimeloyl-ACP methyl ester carboxylesterase
VLVATLQDDYVPLLSSITMPVELVWGSADTAAPLSGAELAEKVLVQAKLTVLADVGHMVPILAPGALREAIGRWAT